MLTIRTAAHIRTARSLKGFRSCAVSTGVCDRRADVSRVVRAEAGLEASDLRRRWLASRWGAHEARAARSRWHRGGEIAR